MLSLGFATMKRIATHQTNNLKKLVMNILMNSNRLPQKKEKIRKIPKKKMKL